MNTQLRIASLVLVCLTLTSGIALAITGSPAPLNFTREMVAGKTMVSSGYPNGSMTFNTNGSLTCTNYPAFVTCKSWQIEPDGKLHREFTDSHTGTTMEVRAYWKLLSNNGTTLHVSQTSNNSTSESSLVVTYR